jgi:hypothetical protein
MVTWIDQLARSTFDLFGIVKNFGEMVLGVVLSCTVPSFELDLLLAKRNISLDTPLYIYCSMTATIIPPMPNKIPIQ